MPLTATPPTCPRCKGLVHAVWFEDFQGSPVPVLGWSCVNCGAKGDAARARRYHHNIGMSVKKCSPKKVLDMESIQW